MPRQTEPDAETWWARYGHRVQPARNRHDLADPGAADPASQLDEDALLRPRTAVPTEGWRELLWRLSGGAVNPGRSETEQQRRARLHRIRRPLSASYSVAVTSMKGGVGKTTVAAVLGLTMAQIRGDRVAVVDANPDAGTLADRLTGGTEIGVRQFLHDVDTIDSWAAVSRYTSLADRLQVLASEQDPAASDAFTRAEYETVSAVLSRYFDLLITDSGTGMVHSAMEGTLKLADALVVVGTPTVDGASRASKTLDWLSAHGHQDLVGEAVVVLSLDRASPRIDRVRVLDHFTARCRRVLTVPADAHLASGGRVELARLRPATRAAFEEVAAAVADGFPTPLV